MKVNEIRSKYIEFFVKNGHKQIPSASLVPENDPTTLFTGSGMQPLVPYLLGQPHPEGSRLVNSQKSFRSVDIDDVGDNRHTTFFEMLGNWSLGDYFKKEQIPFVFNFLVNEIGLDPKRIYVTAFIGDKENNIPKDTESGEIWKKLFGEVGIDAVEKDLGSEENGAKLGMDSARIFYYDNKNWWSRTGNPQKMPKGEPGGPDTEIFYEFSEVEHDKKYGDKCHPNCDCGRYLEIGNSVFMQYVKTDTGFELLPKKNVDFGGGLERICMAKLGKPDIFSVDTLSDSIQIIEKSTGKSYSDDSYKKSFRVISDHIRSSVFLIGDGVLVSNTDRGYFVRRMIRRSVLHVDKLGGDANCLGDVAKSIINAYKDQYKELGAESDKIIEQITTEEKKFRNTLQNGLKEFNKIKGNPTGNDAFTLLTSYGFPLDMTIELSRERGTPISDRDVAIFSDLLKKHQDQSRAGSAQKFKGGLGDTSEMSVRYHTATHLLNAGLRSVLGPHVGQRGSNITPERLRFDFSHDLKMTDEEKRKVEDFVNSAIDGKYEVVSKELPKEEALKIGAIHAFNEKYGDIVTVYEILDDKGKAISREFCGGPHVKNTSELGGPDGKLRFKIDKEEAVAKGIRRIKAVLY